ncbi:MAG: TVP38/TMEM64 family protein [Thainema sp.]
MRINGRRTKAITGLVSIGIAIAVIPSLFPIQEWSGELNQWLQSLGIWALPAFVGLYVLVSVCGLPNVVLLLLAGTLFGFVKGIASASVADTAGAIACFLLGRTLLRKRLTAWIGHNAQFTQLDQAVAQKGWKILLLSRLSPMIPSNILNYGFSLTKISFWQYLLCTWLGMLPIISFYIYIGYISMSLLGGSSKSSLIVLQVAGLGVAIALAIYITHFARKAITSTNSSNQ